MTEHEFSDLANKEDRAQKRVQVLSGFQLGLSILGLLFWIAGFFFFGRHAICFFSCLVFTLTSIILGFVGRYLRKVVKQIEVKMMPLRGASGVGKTRFSVSSSTMSEVKE